MHAQFKPKAGELSSLFESVKHDVEALFMTVPSVDITKLSERLETNQQLLVEMSSVREVLEKDWLLCKDQLARGVDKISNCSGSEQQIGQKFVEECAALQSMNEIHINGHITRIEDCSKILERFTKHCVDCKNAMSRCVHSQMKSIAILQNRISITRNKLSAYKEVSRNIEDACAHLGLVHRIPQAYYSCLGEVIRRGSFAEVFSLHAQKFAESMSSLRQKEEISRHNFEQNYVGLLPQELVFALNLHLAPPICEVHVSPDEYSMLDVGLADIRDAKASAAANRASNKLKRDFPKILEAVSSSVGSEDSAINLQIENASLRAQLASYVAKSSGGSRGSLAGSGTEEEEALKGGSTDEAGLKEKTEAAASEAKEKLIATLANDMASKDRQISEYESKIVELEGKLGVLEIEKSSASKEEDEEEEEEKGATCKQQPVEESSPPTPATLLSRCSSSDFKVQDVALFIENDKGQYEAVNFNSPHYYLSPESLDLSKTQNSRKRHVFGQIVHTEEKVAEKDSQYIYSKDLNLGDRYHLLTICLLE
jgi:chromosome segregation ATPase